MSKPLIRLWEAESAGLIIGGNSGVMYTNQTGGFCCLHPKYEGVYVPIEEEDKPFSTKLYKYFFHEKYSGTGAVEGLDQDDANYIDDLLQQRFPMISVDRSMLSQSHEAWVHVSIGNHPDQAVEDGTWTPEMGLLFYGFKGRPGVLTWGNSD